jgi:hypothetical protein
VLERLARPSLPGDGAEPATAHLKEVALVRKKFSARPVNTERVPSQRKARFWQIPRAFLEEGDEIISVLDRPLGELGLQAEAIWSVEHVYPIFNRRLGALQLIPVFAAELPDQAEPRLLWEHSEFGWFTAAECQERLTFRGLLEGLEWTRRYVSEQDEPAPEFKLR